MTRLAVRPPRGKDLKKRKKRRMIPVEEKFWSKVDIGDEDECWEWNGYKEDRFGYGHFYYGGSVRNAHRVAWILTRGEIEDENLFVCHKCDNPACVNPNHLFLGVQELNMKDMTDKGRRCSGEQMSVAVQGERNGAAKLNNDQVKEIVLLYETGKLNKKEITERFLISKSSAERIIKKESWKHLWKGGNE